MPTKNFCNTTVIKHCRKHYSTFRRFCYINFPYNYILWGSKSEMLDNLKVKCTTFEHCIIEWRAEYVKFIYSSYITEMIVFCLVGLFRKLWKHTKTRSFTDCWWWWWRLLLLRSVSFQFIHLRIHLFPFWYYFSFIVDFIPIFSCVFFLISRPCFLFKLTFWNYYNIFFLLRVEKLSHQGIDMMMWCDMMHLSL